MANWYYRIMGCDFGPMSTNDLIAAFAEGKASHDTYVRRDDTTEFVIASSVKGLLENAEKVKDRQRQVEIEREIERNEKERLGIEFAAAEKKRFENLTVSTCRPPSQRHYEIIDTVFAIDSDGDAGLFFRKDGNPNVAFDRVKQRLKQAGFEIGANAIVDCQFEYRVAVVTNQTGAALGSAINSLLNTNVAIGASTAQAIEIFAYGTAIRYLD